jgi:hypothetical protein
VSLQALTPTGLALTGEGSATELETFTDVCTAPCTAMVSPTGRYRLAGPGLRPTEPFYLVSPESNTIDARMASNLKHNWGRLLSLYIGPPLVLVGGILLATAPTDSTNAGCGPSCPNNQANDYLFGGIVAGLGVATLTTGIVLWASSSSSVSINGRDISLLLPGGSMLKADGLHF